MKNEIDKTIWEAYKDFYGALTVHKDMRNIFEEGLKCFSAYLCHIDQDYAYNMTYLMEFHEDFLIFLEAFNKKYKTVEQLFAIAQEYPNVTLKIDRYWMLETNAKGKAKKSTLGENDFVREEKTMIECSILCNLKRYVFHRNEIVRLKKDGTTKLLKDFTDFLETYSLKVQGDL